MRLLKLKHPRSKLPNGKFGGWMKERSSPADWTLSQKLGDLPRGLGTEDLVQIDPKLYPKILDQGNQGSCGGHAGRSAAYPVFKQKHPEVFETPWGKKFDFSPGAIYYLARREDNAVPYDAGVYIRHVWDALRKYGAPRADTVPYNEKYLVTSLTKKAIEEGKWHQATVRTYRCDDPKDGGSREKIVDRMVQALRAGLTINFGFTCFDNLDQAAGNGVIPRPGPGAKEEGGHAVTSYKIRLSDNMTGGPNSWSEQWGDKGYFWYHLQDIVDGHADDVWAVDVE